MVFMPNITTNHAITYTTVNPLLSPPGELMFILSTFERGGDLIEKEGLKERGGLFNLAKRITCSKNTVV